MTAEAKAALREAVLRRRQALPEEERASLGMRIIASVLDLPAYESSGVVLGYASIGAELGTDEFLRHVLDDGKILLLPRVEPGGLELYEVRDVVRDLAPGTWGIHEPLPDLCPAAKLDTVDFALVPGLAFDRSGRRLGYGGGFYDHLLAGVQEDEATLVSGAFEVQMVDEVPVGPHDVPVDAVVTEEGTYLRNDRPTVLY